MSEVVPSNDRLTKSYSIAGRDFASAGSASSQIKRVLQQIGVDQSTIRRIAVASYEAEMNVVIHAHSGLIVLEAGPESVLIEVKDVGPGIADIDQAMTPGFSTASDEIRDMGFGAGMGLPNMNSCSDMFEITSEVGIGTIVRMTFLNR